MSDAPRTVFLSYAREDSSAAQRVAEALRSSGLEVWFDAHELRGGESWDAKIRKQIRDCTLFLAVISTHTEARTEGYFRREWKLAVERTHDMAAGVAFIVPVVVDDTAEADALVPDEFMRVQWTRLPGALPTPEFVAQVRRLLDGPRRPATTPPHRAPAAERAGPEVTAAQKSSRPPAWVWVVAALVVVGIAGPLILIRSGAHKDAAANPVAAAPSIPSPPIAPALDAKSVAVLPFENMSEEKDANAFFADGMHEDVLTDLSFIRDLHVVSRTSVMQYKGTTKPIGQIAKELNVAYILEGSVRRAGNKVRVTGQLIKAATDEHVWAKSYDRDLTDVFAIQSELSQAIASALQAAISPAEKSLLERKPTENPRAYDLYVQERRNYQGNGIVTFEKTEANLLEAVQLDPGFADAWALLAAIHASQRFNEYDATSDRLDKARSAIETAVRLAPDDPAVIEFHGDYYYYGYRDYTHAAQQYQRLLELQPNAAEPYGSLGLIYRRQGRWADAVANLRKAAELDPHNLRYRGALFGHLLAMREYDLAETEGRAGLALSPDNLTLQGQLTGVPFARTGSLKEVDDWLGRAKPKPEEEPFMKEIRKQVARLRGDYAEALRIDLREPGISDAPQWQVNFAVANDELGAGNDADARERMIKLRPDLQEQLKLQPANSQLWFIYGQTEAVLGHRDTALAAAARLRELLPESADAVGGPPQSRSRAIILAWAGDKEEALAEFARLLQVPYGTGVHGDPLDVAWRPIRDDPRFQALIKDPRNNAPIR